MGGGSGEVEGRSKCAWTFSEHDFPLAVLTEKEFLDAVGHFIPTGFEARQPRKEERINELFACELVFPYRLALLLLLTQRINHYSEKPKIAKEGEQVSEQATTSTTLINFDVGSIREAIEM
ncbi:hypothetical protein KSP39_PZI018798 [Platanthera zijinensis]|uniref:Uncharacterized protein n=1 Tax=Platanthera zijinensis TaxID=2320716 RepID=A0AAP0FYK0_9ASPA